jgi:hypothetical protein
MTRNEKLLLGAAVLLVLFGLFMILGGFANMFDRKATNTVPTDVALILLAGILPVGLGAWLFRHTRAGAARRALEAREQTVLFLASTHHGVLTAPQVAVESGMSPEQAKEVLDLLYRKSFNQMTLSESGEMVYRFQL